MGDGRGQGRSDRRDGGRDEGRDDEWAGHVEAFVDGHYGSLRGRVRTHVIGAHLAPFLDGGPRTVVDVGGGAGTQSIPLAVAGHEVTIIDPSSAMLDRARAAAGAAGVGDRVQLVEARGEDAPTALGGARFDVVLNHGVLMYLDDPAPMVAALCALAGPGGIVSIVAKNVEAMAVLPAHRGDWAGALAGFDATRQINGLGIDTRADSAEHLGVLLRSHGVEPLEVLGVRLFTDGWVAERPAFDDEEAVLAVELEASRRDPYRRLSRLFHLIARRP